MSDTDSIENAQRRLALALDALEAAAERRREADGEGASLAGQVHALGNDRARLAGELDEAAARARALETANREVGGRLDQAIATIRTVLAFNEKTTDGLAADGAKTDEAV
jgi:chromosome segregation ATPase